jgi:small subunit ribosomal protein S9
MAKAITDKKIKEPKKEKKPTATKKAEIEVAAEEIKVENPTEESASASEATSEKAAKKEKYYETIGRRKESVAIIRLYTKKSTDAVDGDFALLSINDMDYREYFSNKMLQAIVESPLRKLKSVNRFKATAKVSGGGLSGQADAIKHGLSRALVLFDLNFRKKLKKAGFLTRDPRAKERRKYGLKKARKAPAWSKR